MVPDRFSRFSWMQVGVSWLQVDFYGFSCLQVGFCVFFSRFQDGFWRLQVVSWVQGPDPDRVFMITGGFGFSWFQVCFHGFFSQFQVDFSWFVFCFYGFSQLQVSFYGFWQVQFGFHGFSQFQIVFLWFQVIFFKVPIWFSLFQVGFFMVFMVPGCFLWSQAGGLTTPDWFSCFLQFQVDVDDDDPH